MFALFRLVLLLNWKKISEYQWSVGELTVTVGLTKLGLFLADTASAAPDRTGFVLSFIGILVVIVIPIGVHGVVGRRSIVILCITLS
jgi:hypothetical protein